MIQQVAEVPHLGETAAGKPINFRDIDPDAPRIRWDKSLIRGNPVEYYSVTVRGTSMTGAGIMDGDLALIRHTEKPESGEIMLVRHGDGSTLKRIRIEGAPGGEERAYMCWEDGSNNREPMDDEEYEIQGRFITIQRGRQGKG